MVGIADIANTEIVLYDLQMKSFDGEPEWAIYAGDHTGIEYLGTSPGDSEGVISVHVRHIMPRGDQAFTATSKCADIERGGRANNGGSMSRELGPETSIETIRLLATRYEATRTALGYDVSRIDEYQDADEIVRIITFSYPSVDLLNKFLDDIDTSTGLRFQEYQGEKYGLLESAEAFEQGLWLVATDQPYQTHEHGALHVFGALGIVDEYLETNQEFIRSVLVRRRAELELPAIPEARAGFHGYDFLRPAHHLARAFGLALDTCTGLLGESALTSASKSSFKSLQNAHEFLYNMRNPVLFNEVPGTFRETPDPDTIRRYAATAFARYDQLEAHAEKLVA